MLIIIVTSKEISVTGIVILDNNNRTKNITIDKENESSFVIKKETSK